MRSFEVTFNRAWLKVAASVGEKAVWKIRSTL
jgi:hypothetical protein